MLPERGRFFVDVVIDFGILLISFEMYWSNKLLNFVIYVSLTNINIIRFVIRASLQNSESNCYINKHWQRRRRRRRRRQLKTISIELNWMAYCQLPQRSHNDNNNNEFVMRRFICHFYLFRSNSNVNDALCLLQLCNGIYRKLRYINTKA